MVQPEALSEKIFSMSVVIYGSSKETNIKVKA